MVRLAMNETTTFRWSLDKDIEEFSKAGFHGIGVWRQKLTDFGEEEGIRLLADSKLNVSSLFWAGGFTGREGIKFEDVLDDAMLAMRLACCMDADCLIVYPGPPGGHIEKHAWRLGKNALTELAAAAEALQVTLAIEPMNARCASSWTFLTDLEDALRLIDEVGSENIKLAYDVYHFGNVDLDFLNGITDRISVVHLGDAKREPTNEDNRCLLGDGQIPVHEIVCALTDGG